MSWPGSVFAGARQFAFLSGITATGQCSDVAAPLLHRISPVVARLRHADGTPTMSVDGGWSQPVDATLYLEGEMECALMGHRFHRGFTAAEKTELWDRWKRGESLKAIGRAFGKPVIIDLFFGGSAWWDSSCAAASLQAGIDACGTRGDFQRRYGTSIGTIDR